jgi:hypothetical protein
MARFWRENQNIVESTPISPFLTNFRVHMASFVDPCKVIVKKNAFSVHPSTQNGSENKKLKKN